LSQLRASHLSQPHQLARRPRRRGVVLPVAALALALLLPLAILLGVGFLLGWRFQPIETASMAPRYPAGSLAVVVPVDPSEIQPGMTIVFEDPLYRDRLVAHRVVRKLPGDALAWETKGDANGESDLLPVHVTGIRGRVGWAIPGLGTAVSVLRGPPAVLLLVILPLALLALTEIADRRRRARGDATLAD
jgi:signal peptidase I